MFMVTIIPLIVSPGVIGEEFKSMRLGGECADLLVVGLGAPLTCRPVGGESWEVLPLADVYEDEVVEIELDPSLVLSDLFLLFLLRLRPLLG